MRTSMQLVPVLVASLVVAAFAPLAAQEAAGEVPRLTARPMEIFGCMLREGQTAEDVAAAADKFNAWMDSTGQDDYFAYVLWPRYRSKDHEADFLWVGGWPTGTMMGGSLESRLTEGGGVRAEVDRVATCPYSANFAIFYLSERNPDPTGAMRFSNCKIAEGREISEVFPAIFGWLGDEKEQGADAQHLLMFPAYGESRDADYDFKWVTASSWSEFGEGWDRFANGGGWRKSRETFDGLLDCDTPRLYSSIQVRGIGAREE